MRKMYNEEYKLAFLEAINIGEASKVQYTSIFRGTAKVESQLGKDLFDMTFEELELVFRKSERTKPQSMIAYIGTIKNYIDWAKVNGYGLSNENPIVGMINEDFVDKYLFKLGKKYYTREELIETFPNMLNHRERAICLAVFEGLFGHELSELINLKVEDLIVEDDKYYAHVLNNELEGTIRKAEISELLYELLLNTNNETSLKTITNGTQKVTEGDYIFRKTRTGTDGCKANQMYFNNVVTGYIKPVLKSKKVNLTTLRISGIMHNINSLMGSERVFTKAIADKIIIEYGLPTLTTNGVVYPHHTPLKRLIDIEWMKEVYGNFKLDF